MTKDQDQLQGSYRIDRRREPRRRVQIEGKLFDPKSNRYFPCRTVDLSQNGALVEITSTKGLRVGQPVSVFAQPAPGALARKAEFSEGEIVRLDGQPSGDSARVAIRVKPKLLRDAHVSLHAA